MLSESRRLRSLARLRILDTPPEPGLDALTRAAALACDAPAAVISLMDGGRHWFKSRIGLTGPSELPLGHTFCRDTLCRREVTEVPDLASLTACTDPVPMVGSLPVRFYAGHPLQLNDGAHAGSLCVLDSLARQLSPEQRDILACLAKAIVELLEERCAARALASSEARFRALSESSPLGIFSTTAEGECTYTNDRWQSIFGATNEQALGHGWATTLHPEDRDALFHDWNVAAIARQEFDEEFRVQHRDGTVRCLRAVARPVDDGQRGPSGYVGTVEDITDRVQQRQALDRVHHQLTLATEELTRQHELLRVTLQSIGDAVITTDSHGNVTWLNPVAERLTGHRSEGACGRPVSQVYRTVCERTRRPAGGAFSLCLSGQDGDQPEIRSVLVARDSSEHDIEQSVAPILDRWNTVLGAVLVFRDVTRQRRLVRTMMHRASHDALTGLVNRTEFEQILSRSLTELKRTRRASALMFIDLDQFKLVNDACGHAAGDRLLIQMGRLLTGIVGEDGTLARLGGDEFGVLLDHGDWDRALAVAQRICERMEAFRFLHEDRGYRIGTSIGLVPFDARWCDVSAALKCADSSCYAAKKEGRNRVHAWSETNRAVLDRRRRMRWATRLAQALDEGRFVLHAQRILSLDPDDARMHAEVLIRLRDTDGSLIFPALFMPAAERFGFSTRIDRWVLGHVVDLLLAQDDRGGVERLFVNLSGRSIEDRVFQRDVIALLDSAGPGACGRLCLEVTETAAMADVANAAAFIERAQALGVRFALDDFGAGAASYGYLKSLPVDVLKIDGQFVAGLAGDALNEAAVHGFVRVARVMGLKTVAEGVDSAETLEQVRKLGVDLAQGFFLHQPEPLTAASLAPAHLPSPLAASVC